MCSMWPLEIPAKPFLLDIQRTDLLFLPRRYEMQEVLVMGVIRRAFHLIAGPTANKLLDLANTCRCVGCCSREAGWQPCDNKTTDGKPECNWCIGANAGEYGHCHGMGNAILRAGWRLEGSKQKPN